MTRDQEMLSVHYSQRMDAHVYQCAIAGHDPTYLAASKLELQIEGRKRSRKTRDRLLALIDAKAA